MHQGLQPIICRDLQGINKTAKTSISADPKCNLYIADNNNNRISEITIKR